PFVLNVLGSALFFLKQKPAYEFFTCLEFRRVLFRSDSGLYRATATLTNMSGSGVDLLFDCGSLLHLRYPGRVLRPDPARICPAEIGRAPCRERIKASGDASWV